ncbi:MAG TPA: hypothetical protein P5268_07950 [Candidatus Marinimicrobia bacterium]|nr:hypothetical protein [Candidatus Neomarinimicrobiota bacterium]HRS52904.1 hypothetical protein [Candidatus Neomarinimicrobiota bacterium]HRU92946.1 hypothetical protein [Candidatus Neomarinimicrobiota bacterium]
MLKIYRHRRINSTFVVVFNLSLIVLFLGSCTTRPQTSVAQYQFTYDNEVYRIRSIYAVEKNERYNELIGKNFLAVDFDQDRIIDKISVGNTTLAEAQKIYDYGLEMLTKENRLKEITPENHKYIEEFEDFHLELKSFYPVNAKPFNQFKITSKKQLVNPETAVAIDHDADGILDEISKGTISIQQAQIQYDNLINLGLQKNKLVKVDNAILVKK